MRATTPASRCWLMARTPWGSCRWTSPLSGLTSTPPTSTRYARAAACMARRSPRGSAVAPSAVPAMRIPTLIRAHVPHTAVWLRCVVGGVISGCARPKAPRSCGWQSHASATCAQPPFLTVTGWGSPASSSGQPPTISRPISASPQPLQPSSELVARACEHHTNVSRRLAVLLLSNPRALGQARRRRPHPNVQSLASGVGGTHTDAHVGNGSRPRAELPGFACDTAAPGRTLRSEWCGCCGTGTHAAAQVQGRDPCERACWQTVHAPLRPNVRVHELVRSVRIDR